MKAIRIETIFWKQGPLLLCLFGTGQVYVRKSFENET
jgi:hypothetical protein